MNKGRILFADNDSRFLRVRSEFLEKEKYEVIQASTPEEVEQLLQDTWVHLAILDIRLVNDNDDSDESGLKLAKDESYRGTPKIIITGFPSVQAVRDALGPALDGLPPAVDFVAKSVGPEAMIQAVKQAFTNHVHINWDLEIQSNPSKSLSFLHLANLIDSNLPKDILLERGDELEDLFRRLFYEYKKIRIDRLLWSDGRQFCISILVQSAHGATNSHILVCGDRQIMEQGRKILDDLTSQTAQGIRLIKPAETTHFRANLYGFPGADIETTQTLRELLQIGKERPLKTAFAHLLGDVLKEWHQRGQMVDAHYDLMSLYRQRVGLADDEVSRAELERQIDDLVQSARMVGRIEIRRKQRQISFHFPGKPCTFPDPLVTVYALLAQYDAPAICRASPGKLKAENILVDSEQRTWLTDFASAGQAPQCWDFICLEAAVRFDASQAPDLLAWQEFEECLMKPAQLDKHLEQNAVIPDLRTNVALIEQIRQQAASEAGPDLIPYYAGLLAWVMEAMSHYDPGVLSTQADRLRGAHLLLAASMLAERLGLGTIIPDNVPAGGELRLDDENRVWIGDRYVTNLSGSSLKLFQCLYAHAGKSVNNRTIVEEVYDNIYDAKDDDQDQRTRQAISRLRDAIEPKPNRPHYIITVREKGYRLEISGESEK
jgi:DNA-binding response OmpR family regulator